MARHSGTSSTQFLSQVLCARLGATILQVCSRSDFEADFGSGACERTMFNLVVHGRPFCYSKEIVFRAKGECRDATSLYSAGFFDNHNEWHDAMSTPPTGDLD